MLQKLPFKPIRLVIVFAFLAAAGVTAGAQRFFFRPAPAPATTPTSTVIPIVTTIEPLTEFARAVGGQHVAVQRLIPNGVEAHDYEPTPGDLARINNARLLVYNGNSIDDWVTKLTDKPVVLTSAEITPIRDNDTKVADPHFWLDPQLASKQVSAIEQALVATDPDHREDYQINAENYRKQLAALDAEIAAGLANCQRRDVVITHNAFRYFAKRYNLNIISIVGSGADAEPSPQRLSEVANFIREHHIPYILSESEELEDFKIVDTLSRETGAKNLTLSTMEKSFGNDTPLIRQGDMTYVAIVRHYVQSQRSNLNTLRTALQCE